jgi:hypothetical protein
MQPNIAQSVIEFNVSSISLRASPLLTNKYISMSPIVRFSVTNTKSSLVPISTSCHLLFKPALTYFSVTNISRGQCLRISPIMQMEVQMVSNIVCTNFVFSHHLCYKCIRPIGFLEGEAGHKGRWPNMGSST